MWTGNGVRAPLLSLRSPPHNWIRRRRGCEERKDSPSYFLSPFPPPLFSLLFWAPKEERKEKGTLLGGDAYGKPVKKKNPIFLKHWQQKCSKACWYSYPHLTVIFFVRAFIDRLSAAPFAVRTKKRSRDGRERPSERAAVHLHDCFIYIIGESANKKTVSAFMWIAVQILGDTVQYIH